MENLRLAIMLLFWSNLYCVNPPMFTPILSPPSSLLVDMVFIFNPPVKPNNKSCDLSSGVKKKNINRRIEREKTLFL